MAFLTVSSDGKDVWYHGLIISTDLWNVLSEKEKMKVFHQNTEAEPMSMLIVSEQFPRNVLNADKLYSYRGNINALLDKCHK